MIALRLFVLIGAIVSMTVQPVFAEVPPLIDRVLHDTPTLRGVVSEPERYRLQVVVAEVVGGDEPGLRFHRYRENEEYWYPASTVKIAAAIAALDRLRELNEGGHPQLTPDTPMRYEPLFDGEAAESDDPSNPPTERLTIRGEVRKSLIVSDNASYNRLYEFAGQDRINRLLREAGMPSSFIVHRLSEFRTPTENRRSPAIAFEPEGAEAVVLPERTADRLASSGSVLPMLPEFPSFPIGRGYIDQSGALVNEPLTFGNKNFISLTDLITMVGQVVRPELFEPADSALALTQEHRELLMRAMSTDPSQSESPVFDTETYSDNWPHFFRRGLERVIPRDQLLVANKVGLAYGFLSEVAYVEHRPSGAAFFIAGVVYVNDSAIQNDGQYQIGLGIDVLSDLAAGVAIDLIGRQEGASDDDESAMIEAPLLYAHRRTTVFEGGRSCVRVPEGAEWVSAVIDAPTLATEAIASWNVVVEEGGGARLEMRAKPDGEAWSEWLPIAETGEEPPAHPWPIESGPVRVDIDTLIASRALEQVQLRVLAGSGGACVHRLDAVMTSRTPSVRMVRDDRQDGRIEREVPFLANELVGTELESRVCSPLCVRALVNAAGVKQPDLDHVAGTVYDERFSIYGNWANAIQGAFELGAPGYLHRFGSWAEVREHLTRVGPFAASIRFKKGELPNAPYDGTDGHLIVIYGLDENGDALVLDPAMGTEEEARRVYSREGMNKAWFGASKGLAYVVLGADDGRNVNAEVR